MQAHPDDRLTRSQRTNRLPWLVLICVLAGGSWYYWQQRAASAPLLTDVSAAPPRQIIQPPAPAPTEPPSNPPLADEAIPTPPAVVAATVPPTLPAADAPPLPPLDDSDAAIKNEAATLVDPTSIDVLASYWQGDNLLRHFVTFVTNLAEGKLDTKSSPVSSPKGRFAVTATAPLQMTPASQARFNTLVHLLTRIEPARCAATYRRYYPLLHTAYAELGEKKTFHSVTLAAIDTLLATPEPTTEPELILAEKGLYKYVSPTLESLPAAQKPLLRMGRENARELKHWLRQLRAAILTTPA